MKLKLGSVAVNGSSFSVDKDFRDIINVAEEKNKIIGEAKISKGDFCSLKENYYRFTNVEYSSTIGNNYSGACMLSKESQYPLIAQVCDRGNGDGAVLIVYSIDIDNNLIEEVDSFTIDSSIGTFSNQYCSMNYLDENKILICSGNNKATGIPVTVVYAEYVSGSMMFKCITFSAEEIIGSAYTSRLSSTSAVIVYQNSDGLRSTIVSINGNVLSKGESYLLVPATCTSYIYARIAEFGQNRYIASFYGKLSGSSLTADIVCVFTVDNNNFNVGNAYSFSQSGPYRFIEMVDDSSFITYVSRNDIDILTVNSVNIVGKKTIYNINSLNNSSSLIHYVGAIVRGNFIVIAWSHAYWGNLTANVIDTSGKEIDSYEIAKGISLTIQPWSNYFVKVNDDCYVYFYSGDAELKEVNDCFLNMSLIKIDGVHLKIKDEYLIPYQEQYGLYGIASADGQPGQTIGVYVPAISLISS